MPAPTAELKGLREEAERAIAQAKALNAAYPNGLPADKKQEMDRLVAVATERTEALQAEAGRLDTLQQIDAIDRALTAPHYPLAHGVNGDDDDRKALERAGWEFKNGLAYKQTSYKGELWPMFPADILLGPEPTAPVARELARQTRAGIGADYTAAYVKHLISAAIAGDAGMAWGQLTPSEQKALSEGSDPGGGFLVPVDTQAELMVRVAARSVIRRFARVVTTSRDLLRFPAVEPNQSAGMGSIYSSGFVGDWVGETPTQADTDPVFQLFEIPVRKLRVRTKLSNDFIADSATPILAWLATNGADNMALTEERGFVAGTGGGLQPKGLLNAGIPTVDVEGTTSDTITNTAADSGSSTKIINLSYALPSQYLAGARWLMRRSVEGSVRKLISSAGTYMWLDNGAGQLSGTPSSLLGYPVENSEFMEAESTNGNKVLFFGDLGQYVIAQRAQITSQVQRELYSNNDQTGIVMWERVGGDLWNVDAARIGIV